MTAEPMLRVRDLGVNFATSQGEVQAVSGVSFDVRAGECLAVVGESGSGKTQVLMGCLGLLAANGMARGSALFTGRELIGATERALNQVRGTGIGLLSQDPLSSLTPHLRIETLLIEGLVDRGLATRAEARERALQALAEVDIPEPAARLRQYPHELSGIGEGVAVGSQQVMPPRVDGKGRDAPARCACGCAHVRAKAAVRGRTDHRARRQRAGARPRTAGGSA